MSENHKAVVVRLGNIRPHSNADRLKLTTIFGNQIIIGLDNNEGDLGLYFNCDLQLSEEFAKANDLVRRKDEHGNPAGGMFEENRRVKCTKLRGEKSDGFYIPISSLSHFGDIQSVKEGDPLDEFCGVPICNKYVVKTNSGINSGLRAVKNPMFHEHKDTSHVGRNLEAIKSHEGSIVITEKLHGTSQRTGNVLVPRKMNFVEKFISNYFSNFINLQDKEWAVVNGTRRVQLKTSSTLGDPNSEHLRDKVAFPFVGNLKKGEVVYYEVVGFEASGKSIMPSIDTTKMRDKKFTKQYANAGDKKTMRYSYGCEEKQADIYVYRITQVNEDGNEFDLTWDAVKSRCDELGVKYTPELFVGSIQDLVQNDMSFIGDLDLSDENLIKIFDGASKGPSKVDDSHIREGICVRLDSCEWKTFKHKSFTFKVLEGIEKELGIENLEDQS